LPASLREILKSRSSWWPATTSCLLCLDIKWPHHQSQQDVEVRESFKYECTHFSYVHLLIWCIELDPHMHPLDLASLCMVDILCDL
jgi:hypothetical protein